MASDALTQFSDLPRPEPVQRARTLPVPIPFVDGKNGAGTTTAIPSRKMDPSGLFGGLDAYDSAKAFDKSSFSSGPAARDGASIHASMFTAEKPGSSLPSTPSVSTLSHSLADTRPRPGPARGAIPDPPYTLAEYLGSGNLPKLAKYTEALKQDIKNNPLTKYEKMQTDDKVIGKGSSKTCFDAGDDKVLLVNEKGPQTLATELHNLKLLEKEGFPTVKVLEKGVVKGRFYSGNGKQDVNDAMVQQKIGDFYLFDRKTEKMHQDFLNSPLLNDKTLDGLKLIKKLAKEKNLSIGDLQGGMVLGGPDKGAFRIADPTHLSTSSPDDVFEKNRMKNLDTLIADVSRKLHGRART